MLKADPANRRDRQAIAFPCLDASLIQVFDHLFIISVLGECTHPLHQCRIVPPLVRGFGPQRHAEFFGCPAVPADLQRHGFCRFRDGDVFEHEPEHPLTILRRSRGRIP